MLNYTIMKKILFSLGLFAFNLSAIGQTPIFSEDFEGVTMSPETQPSLGDVPTTWTLYNEDGRTPAANVGFMGTKAWRVIGYSAENGNAAISTSYYSPVGQSDDWMVSPEITLPNNSGLVLIYDVSAYNPDYPDNYEVLVSKTGNTIQDFTDAPILSEVSPGQMTSRGVLLDDYAGENIHIAFRNVAVDDFLLVIDNIKVMELLDNDVELSKINVAETFKINVNQSIKVDVKNSGANNVTSATIEWTDGVNTHSHEYTGLNITPYAVEEVTLQTPLNFATASKHDITVNITNVNGGADTNPSSNEKTTSVRTVSTLGIKKVVFEEGTGTWCGWCPRGVVAMEHMYDNPTLYPNFIGIAVHNADPMAVSAYDNGANFTGYPQSNVDRLVLQDGVSSGRWVEVYNVLKNIVPIAELDLGIIYNESSREMTATVTSEFYSKYSNANFRLSLVVVEDNVTGSGNGWSQVNYFAGGGSGPMGGFENKPSSVSDITYDRVGRALIGGYGGASGSVPTTINDADQFTYEFNYTVPTSINPSNSSIVALLIDKNTGVIVNATETIIPTTTGLSKSELNRSFKLFPNPASDHVNVIFSNSLNSKVEMNIYTLSGQVVKTESYNAIASGEQIQINTSELTAGEYVISFSSSEGAFVKHLIVK